MAEAVVPQLLSVEHDDMEVAAYTYQDVGKENMNGDQADAKSAHLAVNNLHRTLDGDFQVLGCRKCSTSTPFGPRVTVTSASSTPLCNTPVTGHESGFSESWVATTFAGLCTISSPHGDDVVTTSSPPLQTRTTGSGSPPASPTPSEDDAARNAFAPTLPKMSLFSEFMSCRIPSVTVVHSDDDMEESDTNNNNGECDQCSDASLSHLSDYDISPCAFNVPAPATKVESQVLVNSSMQTSSVSLSSVDCHSQSLSSQTVDSAYYSQLSFSSSLTSSHNEESQIDSFVKQFLPSHPEKLIGRNVGLGDMDIVGALWTKNITLPIAKILGYIDNCDICRLCCVSRTWQSVCEQDSSLRRRKEQCLKTRHLLTAAQKENSPFKQADRCRGLTAGKEPLAIVQNLGAAKQDSLLRSLKPQHNRSEQFWKEAKSLKNDESLRKCPKCSQPAKTHSVQERAWCTNSKCRFDFCIKCRSPFHSSRDCSSAANRKQRSDGAVLSKKSKKNLRRL